MEGFRGLLQEQVLGFAAIGWPDPQVMVLVGPVQADGGFIGKVCIHRRCIHDVGICYGHAVLAAWKDL
jgi:hypothetical protein